MKCFADTTKITMMDALEAVDKFEQKLVELENVDQMLRKVKKCLPGGRLEMAETVVAGVVPKGRYKK